MKKGRFLKEIEEELENLRAGRSKIELLEDRPNHPRTGSSGRVTVSVSKGTYQRLSRKAKQKKVSVERLIEQLVKKEL